MQEWHCAFTRANQEARAAIELTNQDFEVFLPVLDSRPMFPRYLFVRFDRDTDNWGAIKSTRGCVDLLKNGFVPANIPQCAMDAIMSYTPPEKTVDGQTIFTTGQPVTITTGPLAGLQGLFVADRNKRVFALLEICGKRVEVARDSIQAA